jgi:hypothetical protein
MVSRVFRKVFKVNDVLRIRLAGRRSLGRNFHLRSDRERSRRWFGLLLDDPWGLGRLASGTSGKTYKYKSEC